MPVIIPFSTEFSNFREEVSLEDSIYRFEFTWNWRAEQWTMRVLDIDDNPLVSGIPLVLNFNLFAQYPGRRLPGGEFYCIDTTEKEKKITRENMGDLIQLCYIPEAEVDTI